jgi:hypothetical protein
MSTRKVGTFGYREPPAIAIHGTGPNELLDVWRTGVERSPVRVAGELGRVATIIGHPPPTPTELCGAAASLDKPVAEIIVVEISMGSRPIMECVKTECWTEDPFGQGSTNERHCACVKEEYRATESGVGGMLRIIDRAKCRVRAEREFHASARASGDVPTDEERSRKAALDKLPLATTNAVASLFPHGFGFDQLDDHRVELTHDRNAAVAEGKDLFVIPAQRQPTTVPIVAVPHSSSRTPMRPARRWWRTPSYRRSRSATSSTRGSSGTAGRSIRCSRSAAPNRTRSSASRPPVDGPRLNSRSSPKRRSAPMPFRASTPSASSSA